MTNKNNLTLRLQKMARIIKRTLGADMPVFSLPVCFCVYMLPPPPPPQPIKDLYQHMQMHLIKSIIIDDSFHVFQLL